MYRSDAAFEGYLRTREAFEASPQGRDALRAPNLDALPHSLKVSMCVEWNHAWLRWYESEAGRRFSERNGSWFVLVEEVRPEAPPLEGEATDGATGRDDRGQTDDYPVAGAGNPPRTPPAWTISDDVLALYEASAEPGSLGIEVDITIGSPFAVGPLIGRATMPLVSLLMADILRGEVALTYLDGTSFWYDRSEGVFVEMTETDAGSDDDDYVETDCPECLQEMYAQMELLNARNSA